LRKRRDTQTTPEEAGDKTADAARKQRIQAGLNSQMRF
jgi:hypothetical protein